MPMQIGTVLRMDIWIDSDRITASAIVRTCDPGVGNGIEFTGLLAEGKVTLQKLIWTRSIRRWANNTVPRTGRPVESQRPILYLTTSLFR